MKEKGLLSKHPTQYLNNRTVSSIDPVRVQILHAYRRTGFEFDQDMDVFYGDLKSTFPNAKLEIILAAIKNGSTGKYGRTYRMNFQEVCVWIRCHMDNCRPDDLKRSKERL